jgi:KaiC/GvpD/RAD55 family RecA-like ATPase
VVDDPRSDELLELHGRLFWRVNAAIAWTDGIVDDAKAKRCSRRGRAAWKAARPLREELGTEEAAAGYFKTRARRRNPVVTSSGSGWDLVEYDGDRDELDRRHGIPRLPDSLGWRSRRGPHRVYLTPAGETPIKIQIAEEGVTASSDGYLVAAPAWRAEYGVTYTLNGTFELATLPAKTRKMLLELGAETKAETRRRFERGEPIPEGFRNETIFAKALEFVRDGLTQAKVLERLQELNRTQCIPPLDEELVRKQLKGALKYSRDHSTESEIARAKARAILEQDRGEERSTKTAKTARSRRRELEIRRRPLSSVQAEPVEWLIPRVVPVGALTLVAGIGGLGKTALLLAWAKEIAEAGRDVLLVSYEDATRQVLRPRLEALEADLEHIHELYVDELEAGISFPAGLAELDRHVRETNAAAVVIDPVSAAIDLKLDSHRDQDVRVVLGQLAKLAERERLAILENAHLNKAPSSDPYLRINGSTAFYNAARSVLTVTRDPDEPEASRLLVAHKSNYGPLAEAERWRVVPTTVGVIETMKLEFVGIAEDVLREDVLGHAPAPDRLETAIEWLEKALGDEDWHDSAGLKAMASGARPRISERTLKRAAAELEVEVERRGFPSTTWWRLASWATSSPVHVGPTGEGA